MPTQRTALRRIRRGAVWGALCLLCAAAAWADPGESGQRSDAQRACLHDEPGASDPAAGSAAVLLPAAQRFAIVGEAHGKRRRLYGVGDLLPTGGAAGDGAAVEEVRADALRLRDSRTRKSVWMGVGAVIPGTGGRRVEGTVILEGLHYRYVTTGAPDPEPRLIRAQDRCAWLDVTRHPGPGAPSATAPASAGQDGRIPLQGQRDRARLERVQVTPTGPDTYDISGADVRAVLQEGGEVLREVLAGLRPTASLSEGIGLRVQSPVADGVLGPRGFRVDSPNLAQRAGLEAGDVVMAVNGQPVDGFSDLFRLYQRAKRDPSTSTIALALQRQGQILTKTYRIR
jgi:hypothetical protein